MSYDGIDDYAGEYDAEVERVETAARQTLQQAVEAPPAHRDIGRPWWCAHCHAPPQSESDRLYGVCSGCAERDRRARERAKSNAELGLGAPPQRSGRRAA